MTKTEMLNMNRLEVLNRIDIYSHYSKMLSSLKDQLDNFDSTSDNAVQELNRLMGEYTMIESEIKNLACMILRPAYNLN